ncbi:MAG: hypothetical protein H7222_03970 [Methylotenera sp.]|nr:hypothetical protein [Oligoflexia bacterium]
MKAEVKHSIQFRFKSWVLIGLVSLSTMASTGHVAWATDVDSVCGKELKPAKDGDAQASQFKEYCAAAKSADEAASANAAIWKLWAGVATLCTYSCVMSYTNPASFFATNLSAVGIGKYLSACSGANLGVSAADALITKNYMGALMGIASTVATQFMFGDTVAKKTAETSTTVVKAAVKTEAAVDGAAGGPGAEVVETSTTKVADVSTKTETTVTKQKADHGACVTAAMSAFTAITKRHSMVQAEDSVKSSVESAQSLLSQQTSADSQAAPSSFAFNNKGNGPGGGSTGSSGMTGNSQGASEGNSSDPCRAAKNGGGSQSFISCAVSNDSNFPGFVAHPDFAKDFAKITKQSLDSFLNNASSPSAALASGMAGSGASSSSLSQLASLGQQLEASIDNNVSGTSYSHSGGGAAASSASSEPDLGAMMAGLMGQFGGKDGDKAAGPGNVATVYFNTRGRSPSSIAEDRTISIFDRITVRYLTIDKKYSYGSVAQ